MSSVAFLLPRPYPLPPSPRAGGEGQRIATRVDATLYYAHSDNPSTSGSTGSPHSSGQAVRELGTGSSTVTGTLHDRPSPWV